MPDRWLRKSDLTAWGAVAIPITAAILYAGTSLSRGADETGRDLAAQAEQPAGEPPSKPARKERPAAKRAAPARAGAGSATAAAEDAVKEPAPSGQDGREPAAFVPTAAQHAASAKMSRCLPLIGQATQFTAAAPNGTLSQWSPDRPDDHMFQSLIAVGARDPAVARSAAVLVAAPEGRGCEATIVQIQPVPRACGEIEADLKRNGAKLTDLSGTTVHQIGGTRQQMLMPASGSGCIVVGVGLALNK